LGVKTREAIELCVKFPNFSVCRGSWAGEGNKLGGLLLRLGPKEERDGAGLCRKKREKERKGKGLDLNFLWF
jgi:hypothetical protein